MSRPWTLREGSGNSRDLCNPIWKGASKYCLVHARVSSSLTMLVMQDLFLFGAFEETWSFVIEYSVWRIIRYIGRNRIRPQRQTSSVCMSETGVTVNMFWRYQHYWSDARRRDSDRHWCHGPVSQGFGSVMSPWRFAGFRVTHAAAIDASCPSCQRLVSV